MPAIPGIPPNIAAIAGPVLLGYMFDWGLFAVLSMQVYTYYTEFPNDTILSKAIVYTLYTLELAQTMMLTSDAWRMLAAGYGNPSELLRVGTIWFTIPVMSSIVSMIVQIFFAHRLFFLSKSYVLSAVVVAMSLTQGISGIVAGWQAHIVDSLALIPTLVLKATMVWLTGSAICDFCIAVCMIVYLNLRDTGFKETRTIIRKLIRRIIETGAMTAFIATLTIILYGVLPHQTYYVCPAFVIAKSYALSAIAILNNRTSIRKGSTSRDASGNELASSIVWGRNATGVNADGNTGSASNATRVLVEQHQWNDAVELGRVAKDDKSIGPSEDGYDARDVKSTV